MAFWSALILEVAALTSLLIGFFGVGKPERETGFVRVVLVVGAAAVVAAGVLQYVQARQSDAASAQRDKESKERETALNTKLSALSTDNQELKATATELRGDNQELRNMLAPVLAVVRRQHPEASEKEALALARSELEKRMGRLEQQAANLQQRADVIGSAAMTLVFEAETPQRPVRHDSEIHFSSTVELLTSRSAPGFQFSGTVMDDDQVTPTLQRQRVHFGALPDGGLMGRPIPFLKQVQFLKVPPGFLRVGGIGKPRPLHVRLTINGITVELRPITLKTDTEEIIDIADDMKHIDERIGAELAARQK